MFCDEVKVQFIAGGGGKGCIGFRREKFIPRGGPNGGDGGDGGSVYLEANENINTLAEFNTHKIFRAKSGGMGLGQQMAGADAEDLVLPVPLGTIIFDAEKKMLLSDLKNHGERFLVARGGRGGYGNAHFKSSTRQAPTFAELGEPGQQRECVLELKLVADVGFIGLPSVGKSTLLSRVSNARPKIADYPFTTLVPNLGLVTLQPFGGSLQQNFLACDLPGLIEDAHKGRGLGIQFLKHVARNRVLVHLLDINSTYPAEDYAVIMKELKAFDKTLPKKPQLVAFNKIDTVRSEAVAVAEKEFKKKHKAAKKIFAISCVSGEGLKELLFALWKTLEKEKKSALAKTTAQKLPRRKEVKIFRPLEEENRNAFEITQTKSGRRRVYEVTGRRIEQIAVMTDFDNPEAVARVYDVFEKMRINKELKRMGAQYGDEIKVGKHTLIYRW